MSASLAAERAARLAAWWQADPGNTLLLEEAVEAAVSAGDVHGAAALVDDAGRHGLPAAQAHVLRARLALAAGELQQAGLQLQLARQLGAEAALVDHEAAWVAWQQGDMTAALACLAPWVAGDAAETPHREALQLLWLRVLHAGGQLETALDWARSQGQGLAAQVAGVAALVALDADDAQAARHWLARALDSAPLADEALVAAGTLALADADHAGAGHWLAQAQARRPDDGRVLAALGMLALARQDAVQAQALLSRAVRGIPRHPGTWVSLGWAHLLSRALPQAHSAFTQAVACDPGLAEGHAAIALCAVLAGDAQGARASLRRAHGLDPSNGTGTLVQAILDGKAGPQDLQGLVRRVLARPDLAGFGLSAQALRQSRRTAG